MLCWMERYYKGTGIKKPDRIQKKINAGKLVPGIYLLTLSDNPDNLLEILPASALIQKSVAALCPTVIGMEKGKEGAIELAAGIIKEVYEKTGGFALEEFMKNR